MSCHWKRLVGTSYIIHKSQAPLTGTGSVCLKRIREPHKLSGLMGKLRVYTGVRFLHSIITQLGVTNIFPDAVKKMAEPIYRSNCQDKNQTEGKKQKHLVMKAFTVPRLEIRLQHAIGLLYIFYI